MVHQVKELYCYFHVGGKFEINAEGVVQYNDGYLKMKSMREGITFDALRSMIAAWLGLDCNICDMKYTVRHDEKMLINLDDDDEVMNLFAYNEGIDHIYTASRGNDTSSPIRNDVYM